MATITLAVITGLTGLKNPIICFHIILNCILRNAATYGCTVHP